jgi:hypothetical protein
MRRNAVISDFYGSVDVLVVIGPRMEILPFLVVQNGFNIRIRGGFLAPLAEDIGFPITATVSLF